MSKVCILCGVELNGDNTTWYRQKNYIHKCHDCLKVEKNDWLIANRLANPSKYLESGARYRENQREHRPQRYTARQQHASAHKRANALGLPFNLTSSYIESIQVDKCPVLGIELKYGGGHRCDASATLDRIDSGGGYVVGNVQVISFKANLMKSNATPEEMLAFADWVYRTAARSIDKKNGVA
jgi:hypothetical protein